MVREDAKKLSVNPTVSPWREQMESSSPHFPLKTGFIRLWGPRALRRHLRAEVAPPARPTALAHFPACPREGGEDLNGDEREGEG